MIILTDNYEINLNPDFQVLPEETKQIKVVNRLNDAMFKYIFGKNENKGILINFLNSVLDDEGKQIVDLDYLDREASPKIEGGKGCRFDVRAKAKDGRIFHVEVQAGEDINFFERCLFYACESYVGQLKSGELYNELMPLILVGVLGFEQFKGDDVHSRYMFMETERHEIGTDAFELHFFELPKFKNSKNLEGRKFYRWLRYLSSNKGRDDAEIKELEADEMISEVLRAEGHFLSNPESRFRYMQAELDKFLSSKRENLFISKGRKEGREQGRAEGERIKALETAHNLLGMGYPLNKISQATGLSEEEISNKG